MVRDKEFRVVGVLAEELELPENFDAWRPLERPPDQLTPQARANRGLRVIGRLARGKTLAEVQMAFSMARLFYLLDLELESPDYVLQTKVLPTPGPSMKFKVRVKGLRRH